MRDVIKYLCVTYPNGWTHEDALSYAEYAQDNVTIDRDQLMQAIRTEATSVDGILRETNGNYTLRSIK